MNSCFIEFLQYPESERRDVFEAAAERLDTVASYIEKDLWVAIVLDALYHGLSKAHPRLFFKGGTSLSKAFDLIHRFSEDIDIVVSREDLGFKGDLDPTSEQLSNKKRKLIFEQLTEKCSSYITSDMRAALTDLLADPSLNCGVEIDEDDKSRQTLLINYPSLFETDGGGYVLPRIKIECGARSALEPCTNCRIAPYVHDDIEDLDLSVPEVTTIEATRTFWEKLLILHGCYCGYRDEQRLPRDRDRVSRHFYDAAMIGDSPSGKSAIANPALLDNVRTHNILAFPSAWKKFNEAVPGSIHIVPQLELRKVIEKDYGAMQGMILGDALPFDQIIDQLEKVERAVNNQ